jgi:hypothetical protein
VLQDWYMLGDLQRAEIVAFVDWDRSIAVAEGVTQIAVGDIFHRRARDRSGDNTIAADSGQHGEKDGGGGG